MVTENQKILIEKYNAALALYKQRKFKEALAGFEDADKLEEVQAEGQINPSRTYIERCKEYIKNPPGDDWDGVFVMTTK